MGQIGYELARTPWPVGFTTEFVECHQLDLGRPYAVMAGSGVGLLDELIGPEPAIRTP
jgi:hypothetical protein